MTNVVCFYAEPVAQVREVLRRFCSAALPCALSGFGYHNAEVVLGVVDAPLDGWDGTSTHLVRESPLWPRQCVCGYEFAEQDQWQQRGERLYQRSDTGELVTTDDKIPGMIYDIAGYHKYPCWCGPDGKALHVVLPNRRTWHIDGQCNNCPIPADTVHKCWVRTGTIPRLTVSKGQPGESCDAGAGSIWSAKGAPDEWHGFLTDGVLKQC